MKRKHFLAYTILEIASIYLLADNVYKLLFCFSSANLDNNAGDNVPGKSGRRNVNYNKALACAEYCLCTSKAIDWLECSPWADSLRKAFFRDKYNLNPSCSIPLMLLL